MRVYAFYAYVGERGTRISVLTVRGDIVDWVQLKGLLRDAMLKVHYLTGETRAILSLERYKPGRWFWAFKHGAYIQEKFRYGREFEAFFKVELDPKTSEITVRRVSFSWSLQRIKEEFYKYEKGIKYKVPPLIPKSHKSLLENPAQVLAEQSGLRYVDYSRKPQSTYTPIKEKWREELGYGKTVENKTYYES